MVVGGSALRVPLWKMALVTSGTIAWCAGVIDNAARGKDDWPLSAFAMYCDRASRDAIRDRMYGIADDREFLLTEQYTYPVAGTRLNFMLRKMRGASGRAGLRQIQRIYDMRRQMGMFDEPPLTAIRTERETWRTNRELTGIDHPKHSITLSVFFAPEPLVSALVAEAKGDPLAAKWVPHRVAGDDIVIEAESAELLGNAHRVDDARASGGAAVELPEEGVEARPDVQRSGAQITFDAPAGTYTVWMRLERGVTSKADSIWVSVDGVAERQMVNAKSGIGALPDEYPAGAFAWAGSALPGPQITLAESGPHVLYLSPRQGPVTVDQVWLSRTRRETPVFHEPVAK